MINKIINYIYNFDVMGPIPKLYIFNKERYQSIFSLIVSLLVIILSIIYIFYSLIDYFKNEKPTVVYSKSNDKSEQRKINLKDMLLMFQSIDYKSMKKINDSFIDFETTYTEIYDNAKVNYLILNAKKCKPGENMNKNYERYLKEKINELSQEQIQEDKNVEDFYCISSDSSDISLFYNPNIGYSYIDLNIILKNQSMYIPEDLALMIVYENNLINHDDKKVPISESISYDFIRVFNSKNYYSINFKFQYLKYETDDGLFFDNLKYLKGVSFLDMTYFIDNQQDIDLEKNYMEYNYSKIGTISFSLNKSNYDFYRRTYKKVQTLLAEIMSIVSILFEIGRQIVAFINEKKMSVDIIRKLFNIDNKYNKNKFNISDNRIKLFPDKINNSFILSEKNSINIESTKIKYNPPETKNEKVFRHMNIFHIIKSFICNDNKSKLISLCHDLITEDLCVENILEKFYNLRRIYHSISDNDKYKLGLNKEHKFREINSKINDIYIELKKAKSKNDNFNT